MVLLSVSAVPRPTYSFTLIALGALMLVASVGVFAQDNSFATTIQNNAMWQSNLTKQMINLGGPSSSSVGPASPASCMPPVDLQRGVDGHVPPALQGDPRYQEYLRCRQGESNPQNGRPTSASPASCMPPVDLQRGVDGHVPPALQGDPRYQEYLRCRQGESNPQNGRPTSASPSFPIPQHLPIAVTDFVPAQQGHPIVDQAIGNMSITSEQRVLLRNAVQELFNRVATQYRGNNLAVSISVAYLNAILTLNGSQMNPQQTKEFVYGVNDKLAQNPKFALMSPLEKQTNSDRLIFQSAMIGILRDLGERDPRAKQQAMELSRAVLGQLNGS